MKSVETRDAELTQMNKSYFDELQRHVDDTSEELRRTFAEFKVSSLTLLFFLRDIIQILRHKKTFFLKLFGFGILMVL